MQISVQLYSVREALGTDPVGTLTRLRDLGLREVEPFGLVEHAAMLRSALPDLGLRAPTTHADLLGAEDQRALFATAAELGIGTVIQPHRDPDLWKDEAEIRHTAELLDAAAETARGEGVRVGYHNHGFEADPRFEGRTGLEVLDGALGPDVVLEVDTYWAAVGGSDPVTLLGTLGDRVRAVHLKDGPRSGSKAEQQPLGRGEIDVDAIVAASRSAGHLGVIEFDDYAGDIFEGVAASLAYLQDHDDNDDEKDPRA
ncbi:sugar phosphate isomerase/epimerase [Brachybacterium endophyticum]|uniref:Sugar phosphate isomerase/epimerase n=1 Tax=Brachybacterium endophyticum TaxID=2182385 RepID=A0A2U2RIX0_9MICO|nr:sugar phosphate isomerase/epimerase [Brachybacterium endophyticum]PWH05734.1 sugar phosphate isomerase/epimerase [Brachybacterium endophyticum]